jgi:H+/Cl- antiporter ClcA
MSNYFKRFIEWQNYVHYILLGIGLMFYTYVLMYLSDYLFGSDFAFKSLPYWVVFTFFIIIGIFIIDSIVHAIFWFAPKPIQWRD